MRIADSDGSSGVLTDASAAETLVESPGMSNRSALPVACALLMPVLIRPVVVSNAAEPGRPAVSFAGDGSCVHCQMSPDTAPIVTALPALAWPGRPGLSMNAIVTLSK